DSTTRLRRVMPRSWSGEKSRGSVTRETSGARLFGGHANGLCLSLPALDAVDQLVELAHDRDQFLEPCLALPSQRLEGRERRADVADRVAGGAGERFRIALVAVGRMALVDDRLHPADQPLDLLRLLEAPLDDEVADARGGARNVVAIRVDVADGAVE